MRGPVKQSIQDPLRICNKNSSMSYAAVRRSEQEQERYRITESDVSCSNTCMICSFGRSCCVKVGGLTLAL